MIKNVKMIKRGKKHKNNKKDIKWLKNVKMIKKCKKHKNNKKDIK
jgi:hypothetical protein